MADWKSALAALGATKEINDNKEKTDIDREFSEKHAGEVVAGELTKPSGCKLH